MFKFILILIVITSSQVFSKGYSQSKINVSFQNVTLKEALKEIEKKSDYHFLYSDDVLTKNQSLTSLNVKNASLSEAMAALLSNTNLDYKLNEDNLVILSEKGTAAEVVGVTGRVTDESDAPIPGVTVKVKGTSVGTQTDMNGKYVLNIPDADAANAIIVFSFIGYTTLEMPLAARTNISVQLKAQPNSLNEVVVIGYGQQKKGDVTSAVTSVQAKDFVTGPVTDAAELLKGKVAGLSVSNPSGDPNAQSEIILRGINTVGGTSTALLIIVDGVPGDLLTVAPEDIAEISVLKDASATAIYGVNGSDGVIIVTTKHASGNIINRVDYSGNVSTSEETRIPQLLTAQDYRNQITAGTRQATYDLGSSTDWIKAMSNNHPISDTHNLTFRGGNSQTNYLASLNYRFLDGIFQQNNHQQVTGRVDINHSMLNGKLKFNLGILQTNFDGLPFNQYDYEQALKMNPTAPVKEPNGSYYQETTNFEYQNPLSDIYNTSQPQTSFRSKYNATVTILPVEGLRLVGTGAYTKSGYLNKYFANFENISTLRDQQNGVANISQGQEVNRYLNLSAEYSKTAGDHHFGLLAGYEYQDDNNFQTYMNNHDFPTDIFGYNNIIIGQSQTNGTNPNGIGSSLSQTNLISYFARATYSYKDKYLLLASLRIDGASQFYGTKQPYGRFPGIQAGWKITNEEFMKDQHIFDELKLRAGYGVTGKPPIAGFLGVGLLGYGNYTLYNGQWIQTLAPSQNANPSLKWEEKHETNLGLDFSILKGLVTGTIDVYDNKTLGLLYNYAVPSPPNLFQNTFANAGNLENKGLEIAVNITPVKSKNFQWTSGFTFSTNQNKLISLSNDLYKATTPYFTTGYTLDPVQTTTNIVQVGQPIGQFFGFKVVGVSSDGSWIYKEPNGTIVPYAQFNHSFADKQVLGNGIPKYYAGWTNNLKYKNLDLAVTMRGAFDFQVLNLQRLYFENTSVQNYNRLASSQDKVFGTAVLNKNMPEEFNSYYIENGAFWKIDNINLGYTFREVKSKYIHDMRLSLSTNNTFIITGYKGTDPEVSINGAAGGNGLAPGVDSRDTYPTVRTFTLGFSASF